MEEELKATEIISENESNQGLLAVPDKLIGAGAIKELKSILESRGIFLSDLDLEKCGLFYLILVANSLKIKLNL